MVKEVQRRCLIASIIIFSFLGCVRKVYLPEDAATYKMALEKCQEQRDECAELLTDSERMILELEGL